MNKQLKKRLVVVSGIVVIVLIVVLAIVGSGTAAKSVSVADAASGAYADKKIQVSGNVVADSYSISGQTLSFTVEDADDPTATLPVTYEGAVSATFGNGVTAICTGKIDESGVLRASEMVTKCPSKYESSTDALSVARLLEYGESVTGKPVKVTGYVVAGTLQPAGSSERFKLSDAADGTAVAISVAFDDALANDIQDGTELVLTGSMDEQGSFRATEVALKG